MTSCATSCGPWRSSVTDAANPADGIRLSFEDGGTGEPVLLLHGSTLSRVVWRGLGYTAALRGEYRVLAMDLRGHGRSGRPHGAEDYRMELQVGDVLAVLDAAEVESAHLVGYSLGARVGFGVVDAAPHRVRSLVSLGGTPFAPKGGVADVFFAGVDETLATGGMDAFIDRWGERRGVPIDPQTALALRANDPLALRALFAVLEAEQGIPDERLASMSIPTLLIAGGLDRARATDSARAATLMPDARYVELPGRDHATTLLPSAEVLELILQFLRAHQAEGL